MPKKTTNADKSKNTKIAKATITELLSYFNAADIVYRHYDNLAHIGDDYAEAANIARLYNNAKTTIFDEIENRVEIFINDETNEEASL